jgi:hypothetical protein
MPEAIAFFSVGHSAVASVAESTIAFAPCEMADWISGI